MSVLHSTNFSFSSFTSFIPVPFRSRPPARSPELRMKLGEALVNATRNCGDMVPRFSQHLLPALLTGVKDPEPLIRASSLSNLGEVCQLLRFSLGPVVHEVSNNNKRFGFFTFWFGWCQEWGEGAVASCYHARQFASPSERVFSSFVFNREPTYLKGQFCR